MLQINPLSLYIELYRLNFCAAESMGSNAADVCRKFKPEAVDQLDELPDEIFLSIINRIGDARALNRCCAVSKRFHSLVPQVANVVLRVDCFRSELEEQLLDSSSEEEEDEDIYESPSEILKNFNQIKRLRIELPAPELSMENDAVLLKWKAEFGSALESCLILTAANTSVANTNNQNNDDSFITNGGLDQRILWTFNSLTVLSARHYKLQPLIAEQGKLESLILTDVDGQGVMSMDKEQLEALRTGPICKAEEEERTLVPDVKIRVWYAPRLGLADGTVLEGATLVAIRAKALAVEPQLDWIVSAFEEPYHAAVRVLVKRRIRAFEMSSF